MVAAPVMQRVRELMDEHRGTVSGRVRLVRLEDRDAAGLRVAVGAAKIRQPLAA